MKKIVFVFGLFLIFCWACGDAKPKTPPPPRVLSKALQIGVIPQQNHSWCWAAGIQMFLSSYQVPTPTQMDMAKILLGDTVTYQNCVFCTNSPSCYLNVKSYTSPYCNVDLKDSKVNFIFKKVARRFPITITCQRDFKWDTLKNRINRKNSILLKFQETNGFIGGHYVLITGYLEVAGYKLMMVKDPWLPCKGCQYLMNFETMTADAFFIYPKKTQKSSVAFEDKKYFKNATTLLNDIVANDYLTKLDTGKVVGYIPVIYTQSGGLTPTIIAEQQKNPTTDILVYKRGNFILNALCKKESSKWNLQKLFFSKNCNLLCCGDSCNLSYEARISDKTRLDSAGNNVMTSISINPKAIWVDQMFGLVFKQYQIEDQAPFLLPVGDYQFNHSMPSYKNPLLFFNKLKDLREEIRFKISNQTEINRQIEINNQRPIVIPRRN